MKGNWKSVGEERCSGSNLVLTNGDPLQPPKDGGLMYHCLIGPKSLFESGVHSTELVGKFYKLTLSCENLNKILFFQKI